MSVSKLATDGLGGLYISFHCEGCDQRHVVPVSGPKKWKWNASLDKPTIKPSILIYGSKRDDGTIYRNQCHSNVDDGSILWHADSWHNLAGQTRPLPDLNDVKFSCNET